VNECGGNERGSKEDVAGEEGPIPGGSGHRITSVVSLLRGTSAIKQRKSRPGEGWGQTNGEGKRERPSLASNKATPTVNVKRTIEKKSGENGDFVSGVRRW